ncbi:hypothetical protein PILCRDRAFT_37400, partial [Piloderma croceum F 1598]
LLLVILLPLTCAAETILGAYIFHRHGDRTPKSIPPVDLTDLGYSEVYSSGQYHRQRYIDSAASSQIAGISADVVVQGQITMSTSDDVTLMNSAQGFAQGLYPPVGDGALSSQILRNGTTIQIPLEGYQLIPVHTVSAGSGSESAGWLQGSTGCANAEASSNQYYTTEEYTTLLASTSDFYKNLYPVVNGTFSAAQTTFQNAYTIYDVLNVAEIHNSSLNTNILTDAVFFQTRTLADNHEYNLAYNASSPIRAIAGATLAAQIVQALNQTISSSGQSKLNVQFGSYGSFFSFFGLAQLPAANSSFFGIPDYASFMTFELVTNSSVTPFPAASDISVRFLFHNGTVSNSSGPIEYPLFGQQQTVLPWTTFADEMNKFAIGTQDDWCVACGNTTGICAIATPSSTSTHTSSISNAVAGVIGAMVALAVVLGVELLVIFFGGLTLRKR